MKSGNVFTMKFEKFSMNQLSEGVEKKIVWEKANVAFTVDVNEIEAVKFKKVWF